MTPDQHAPSGEQLATPLDHDYSARATVSPEQFERIMVEYRRRTDEATRDLGRCSEVVYDTASGQQLDVWGIGGAPRPVFIALHGGYWRALSRHETSFMARVLDHAGIATVSVDYALAPTVPLEEIVREIRAAVAWVYHHGIERGLDPRRIIVGGSSAGAHLAACTLVHGWQQSFALPDDAVRGALLISGLYDLRPLVGSFANAWLRLDPQRAAALSPLLAIDASATSPIVMAMADQEAEGFRYQSRRFHQAWSAYAHSELLTIPHRNHFSIFLDLADRDSRLTRALLRSFRRLREDPT